MARITRSLDEALALVSDGCMLAVPRETSGVAMAATRALIRRGVKRLHLVALPTSTLQADLLIGADAIETLETSAVSLGEFGPAPRFTDAMLNGRIRMREATCPALHAAFQAAEKGVPFMPLRGILGSDILAPIAQPAAKAQAGGVLYCRINGSVAQGQHTANGLSYSRDPLLCWRSAHPPRGIRTS